MRICHVTHIHTTTRQRCYRPQVPSTTKLPFILPQSSLSHTVVAAQLNCDRIVAGQRPTPVNFKRSVVGFFGAIY